MRCAAWSARARSSSSRAARSSCAGSFSGLVSGSGLGTEGESIAEMRCGGQSSPAPLTAWYSLASVQFRASASASSCCHPAICCCLSSGCGCGSPSGWACPRRCSSAVAFPAVSLVAWVSADHCSYRVLSASRQWRSAASCAARAVALAAAARSCWVWASADCRWASAGLPFPGRVEPADLVQLGDRDFAGEQPEHAPGFDGAELSGIAGGDDPGPGLPGRFAEHGQVGCAELAGLV